MSEEKQEGPPRPRQVTMGAWVAGGCSAAMLLVVGQVISRLNTVDFRDGVSSFLSDQRAAGISVGLDDALLVIRIGLMVCGAVAAAIVVFAFFAARRDRSARVAMSVLALPLLVTGVFIDPFLAGFVVAATVLLWTSPASAWFAGRTLVPAAGAPTGDVPVADRPGAPSAPSWPPPLPPSPPSPPPVQGLIQGSTGPAPTPGWPPAPPYGPPAVGAAPRVARAHRASGAAGRRPVRVLVAGLLAGSMSALMAGAMVLTAFVVQSSAGRADLRTVLRDNPSFSQSQLSVDQVATACSVIAGLIAVWALFTVVFAAFAIAGRRWARVALLISAGLAGLATLVSSLAFLGFLVITAAAVLSGVLLINPDVNAWYAGRPRPSDQPPVPQTGPPSVPPSGPPPSSPW